MIWADLLQEGISKKYYHVRALYLPQSSCHIRLQFLDSTRGPDLFFSVEAKKKGSKIWGRSFAEIPRPLSETDMQANRPTRASGWCARSSSVMETRVAARVIVPLCGVASRALIAKFNNTCSINSTRHTRYPKRVAARLQSECSPIHFNNRTKHPLLRSGHQIINIEEGFGIGGGMIHSCDQKFGCAFEG